MKAGQFIQKLLRPRGAIGVAVAILIVSLGLLCTDPPGRSGGRGWGVGLNLGGCSFQILSADGAAGFLVTWNFRSDQRNGFFVGTASHLWEYHWGLHLNILGFGFGISPSSVRAPDFGGTDFVVPPHIGFTIPFWFTCAVALGVLLFKWYLHLLPATALLPEQADSRTRLDGVRHWLLTCSLTFAAAEFLWLWGQYVKRLDIAEIPMIAPLLPLVLLFDSREVKASPGEWLPYALAFWAALLCVSLILSRRRTNPAIGAAVLLGLACLFGVLVAVIAT